MPPCPGEGCRIWDSAAGSYDEKFESDVCGGCTQCGGNPPKPPPSDDEPGTIAEPDEENIEELFTEIAGLIDMIDSGFQPDWDALDFEKQRLIEIWREAEREIARIQSIRFQAFIKGWFKAS